VTAIHLIRHAKAKNRLTWDAPDDLRPLTKRGRREAQAIAERLGEKPVLRLVSSPAVRCLETLEPLAVALDLPIETTNLLAEGADGESAVDLLLSLVGSHPIACCTHGDVLFEVVDAISRSGVPLDGPRAVPVASTWVLDVDGGQFVGGRFVEQPPR
jgi:phosphohistidine phosphatase SixA